jgi:hypothetical protein
MKNTLKILLLLTIISSCKKDPVCIPSNYGANVQYITTPDSALVHSIIVVKFYWRKSVECESFSNFHTDTLQKSSIRVTLRSKIENCNCNASSEIQNNDFTFSVDTIGPFVFYSTIGKVAHYTDTIWIYQ